jgi:hypothetical protein
MKQKDFILFTVIFSLAIGFIYTWALWRKSDSELIETKINLETTVNRQTDTLLSMQKQIDKILYVSETRIKDTLLVERRVVEKLKSTYIENYYNDVYKINTASDSALVYMRDTSLAGLNKLINSGHDILFPKK